MTGPRAKRDVHNCIDRVSFCRREGARRRCEDDDNEIVCRDLKLKVRRRKLKTKMAPKTKFRRRRVHERLTDRIVGPNATSAPVPAVFEGDFGSALLARAELKVSPVCKNGNSETQGVKFVWPKVPPSALQNCCEGKNNAPKIQEI